MNQVAGEQLENIARGGTLNLAGAAVSAAANFFLVVVITNSFSKETAGGLFSASSLFLLVLAVASLGMDAGLGRFTLKYVVEQRWDWVRETLRNTGVVTLAISTVAGLVTWWFADPLAQLLGLAPDSGPLMIQIFAIGTPLSALGNWALSASRAFSDIRQTVVLDKLLRSLLQLGLVGACAIAAADAGALTWAWMAPSVLLAPLAILGLRRIFREAVPAPHEFARAPQAVGEFWRFTGPRSVAQVAQMVVQRADIILIGAMISPAAAAVYTAATRFVPLGQLGVSAVQQVIQPRFTHLLATKEHAALAEVFRTTTAWSITLAWPIYLAIGSVPGLYLRMFGEGFAQDGVTVVVVMMLAMLVGIASGPVDTLLLMSGRTWLSLSNALVALVIDIVGCFVLIPLMGIAGAAVAWCAAIVAKSVLGYYQVRRYERISAVPRIAVAVALAAVVCFGVPGLVLSLTGLDSMLNYAIVMMIGFGCYVAFLWWRREPLRLVAMRALLPTRLGGTRS